jgi:hypothetical protein
MTVSLLNQSAENPQPVDIEDEMQRPAVRQHARQKSPELSTADHGGFE